MKMETGGTQCYRVVGLSKRVHAAPGPGQCSVSLVAGVFGLLGTQACSMGSCNCVLGSRLVGLACVFAPEVIPRRVGEAALVPCTAFC
jgi:hypothetical protein